MTVVRLVATAALAVTFGTLLLPVNATAMQQVAEENATAGDVPPARGPVLPVLYISLAALNAYDGIATLSGTRRGAVETNRLMAPIARNAPAMWLVKGATTAGEILAAERL